MHLSRGAAFVLLADSFTGALSPYRLSSEANSLCALGIILR